MVELKDKTVEELRKMASRKKIEGRSKMNKSELVRALKKKTTLTKKTSKRRKMKGGVIIRGVNYDLGRFEAIENHLFDDHGDVGLINLYERNQLNNINTMDQLIARHIPNPILTMNRDNLGDGFISGTERVQVGNRAIQHPFSITIGPNVYYIQIEGDYLIINFDTLLMDLPNNNNNVNWYNTLLVNLGLGQGQKLFPLINPNNQIPH
jgi:hypothetical protein